MDAADDMRFDYVASLQLARRLWALARRRSNELRIEPATTRQRPRSRTGSARTARSSASASTPRTQHGVRHRQRSVARRRTVGGAMGRGDERAELDQLRPRDQAGRGRPQPRRGHLGRHRRPRRPAARTTDHRRSQRPPASTPPAPSRGTDPCPRRPPIPPSCKAFVDGVKAARTSAETTQSSRRLACRRARSPPATAT